jgi:hypothetical protein
MSHPLDVLFLKYFEPIGNGKFRDLENNEIIGEEENGE